jgi:formate-dependent nitrite reductase cytochrome c552 subunit
MCPDRKHIKFYIFLLLLLINAFASSLSHEIISLHSPLATHNSHAPRVVQRKTDEQLLKFSSTANIHANREKKYAAAACETPEASSQTRVYTANIGPFQFAGFRLSSK